MTNILTLRPDPEAHAFFNRLRQAHFPPERNLIDAHVTMFHTLPSEPGIASHLRSVATCHEPFRVAVTGLRSLGGGVAYTLASESLMRLHAELAGSFREVLTAQDRHPFQPHIVVQNKVSPAAARDLLADLRASFVPMEFHAIGLDLWAYLGGPWRHIETCPFRAPAGL